MGDLQNMDGSFDTDDSSAELPRDTHTELERATSGNASQESGVLRAKARSAIEAGQLPHRQAEGVWGGPGSGACCAVCASAISPDGLGFELEFTPDGDGARAELRHFHVRCYEAWEIESQQFLQAAGQDGTISIREHAYPSKRGPG